MKRLTLFMAILGTMGCTDSTKSDGTYGSSDPTDSDDTGSDDSGVCAEGAGCLFAEELPFGLLSVQIPADDDVWIVGSSPEPADGTGPAILHYDGSEWERIDTDSWAGAELWWSWIGDDEALFVGNEGLILEMSKSDGSIQKIDGPAENVTFFGVWGASSDDIWAVGMTDGGEGPRALWRRQAGAWAAWEDPALGTGEDNVTYFKVHGTSADDVWFAGNGGRTLHWDGSSLTAIATDAETPTSTAPLLTIDANPEQPVVVGGIGNGLILEYDGSIWQDRSPEFQPGFNGVCSGAGYQWAVGQQGSRARRNADGAWISDMDLGHRTLSYDDWHGCAIAPNGDLWAVGGRIAQRPLSSGIIGFQGSELPAELPSGW